MSCEDGSFILFHRPRLQSILVEKPRWQKYKAAGHFAIIAKKQRGMMAGAQLQSRTPAQCWDGSFYLHYGSLETPSQIPSEICFLCDPRSHQLTTIRCMAFSLLGSGSKGAGMCVFLTCSRETAFRWRQALCTSLIKGRARISRG